jgi:hypothetical protein
MTAFAQLARKIALRERENFAMDGFSDEAAVYLAMLKAGFTRKPKTAPADYARRFAHEKLSLQRHYCVAFALWRRCAQPVCRRQQECRGNANACLKRALDGIPRDRQRRAREAIVAAIPCNIGAPERAARLSMPHDLTD